MIRKYLSSKKEAIDLDRSAFTRWAEEEITTDECIKRFIRNNRAPIETINKQEFISWLNSLGYKRRNYENL